MPRQLAVLSRRLALCSAKSGQASGLSLRNLSQAITSFVLVPRDTTLYLNARGYSTGEVWPNHFSLSGPVSSFRQVSVVHKCEDSIIEQNQFIIFNSNFVEFAMQSQSLPPAL